jgi:hypothetical protein
MKSGIVLYTDVLSKYEFLENRIGDSHAVSLYTYFPSFLAGFGEIVYRGFPHNATEQLWVL